MEIAIPLIALGGMYIVTNQNEENINKNNKNIRNRISQGMQNVNSNIKENMTSNISSNNLYSNNYEEETQQTHTNMLPLNGGKVRGAVFDVNEEALLDARMGYGTHAIKKEEQGPLFKPEDSITNTYGMQNTSSFMESRARSNLSDVQNGIKPFESQYVGPGIGKGMTGASTGGFNAGMEGREYWQPKTVDELRISTNPKMDYKLDGHEGPAYSYIQTPSTVENIGRFEKNRPDRHYENTQDMWLTTTGTEKASTFRSQQVPKDVQRGDREELYNGHAVSDKKGTYAHRNFQQPKRTENKGFDVTNSNAVGKGPIENHNSFVEGYDNKPNHRSTTKSSHIFGSVGGAMGAVIAPLMDIFRPTYREEVANNMRVYGDATGVPSGYMTNENHNVKTTVKEQTLYTPDSYMNNQKAGTYLNTQMTPHEPTRHIQSVEYSGVPVTNTGYLDHSSAYLYKANDTKYSTDVNRTNVGGTQRFNGLSNTFNGNVSLPDKLSNVENTRSNAPFVNNFMTPSNNLQGITSTMPREKEDLSESRMHADLLQSFKENPYTHSLSSI